MGDEGKKGGQWGAIEIQPQNRTQSHAIKIKSPGVMRLGKWQKHARQLHAFVRLLMQDAQSFLETALPFSNTVTF
jgi:hypothetical protein